MMVIVLGSRLEVLLVKEYQELVVLSISGEGPFAATRHTFTVVHLLMGFSSCKLGPPVLGQ